MLKQDDLAIAVEWVNQDLKEKKARVAIIVKSGWFYLRATLPPREDIEGKPKSQYLASHIPASKSNIPAIHSLAEDLALDIKIWKRVHGGLFNWDNWKVSRTPSLSKPKSNELNLLDLWVKYIESIRPSVTYNYYFYRLLAINRILIRCRDLNTSFSFIITPSLPLELKSKLVEITTPKQIKTLLEKLSSCCKWGIENGLIKINPFLESSKSISVNSKDVIFPFTKEERDLIISSFESACFNRKQTLIQTYYAPYVKFCFFTGCRPSEAIGLQWNHITNTHIIFQQVAIKIAAQWYIQDHLKTQKYRKFPINSQLQTILDYQKILQKQIESNLVFPPTLSRAMYFDLKSFRITWKLILDNLKIEYRPPYQMRHTFITLCLEAGIDAKDVANWVGNTPDIIYRHYAGSNNNLMVPIL